MDVTQECLMAGIAQMRKGNHVGDIGAAVQRHAEAHGYGVVRELVGHGVGREMHEEPHVPNFGQAGTGMEMRPGLVLAIEPMITQGDRRSRSSRTAGQSSPQMVNSQRTSSIRSP